MLLACCSCCILSSQPDFRAQQCAIEEQIKGSLNEKHHHIIYYPKFHCKLNHIEHFWCASKAYARNVCDYTLDGLQKHVPEALASVRNSTILTNYHQCRQKMNFYRQGIKYGSSDWVERTSHQKVTIPGENR